jgi:hypothetical protein
MYSDGEVDAAVAAGVLSAQNAAAFRAFVAQQRTSPDEEQFRLLSGFNDIFVSIALAVFLIAASWLGGRISDMASGAVALVLSWLLAEYFTRRRRLALPSIVLAVSYGIGAVSMLLMWIRYHDPYAVDFFFNQSFGVMSFFCVMFVLILSAYYLHWRRFQVPITVTFCAVAALAVAFVPVGYAYKAICGYFAPGLRVDYQPLVLVAGLVLFGVAMWWDISDRQRITRRTDVAFWLHLCAAPMIVHSLFGMLGVFSASHDAASKAVAVVGLYVLMTLAALMIDRRALLTAALAYVLYAISSIIRLGTAPDVSLALAGLVIGGALLMLSAGWHATRKLLVSRLPTSMRNFLPAA